MCYFQKLEDSTSYSSRRNWRRIRYSNPVGGRSPCFLPVERNEHSRSLSQSSQDFGSHGHNMTYSSWRPQLKCRQECPKFGGEILRRCQESSNHKVKFIGFKKGQEGRRMTD
ncbi:hypothetical protein TNCV_4568941 [Trichonephila clavipes]|nr:hypothetical protein TNCV_4568941 [Trichonephila clavipes]